MERKKSSFNIQLVLKASITSNETHFIPVNICKTVREHIVFFSSVRWELSYGEKEREKKGGRIS
jgi:hypothetical protein